MNLSKFDINLILKIHCQYRILEDPEIYQKMNMSINDSLHKN